ncbi:MAG TPA: SGNH/GDSL hydrolase family protein [Streptosporangiaceae bacterium]|nr:SGNH/GDSL hydrolase family protein [Streptosporangiaceae bacterium]
MSHAAADQAINPDSVLMARWRKPSGRVAAALIIAAVALPTAVVAAIFTFAGSSAPPASTGTHRSTHAGRSAPALSRGRDDPGYLALGDSIAFGYRPASVTTAMSYLSAANFTGYPEDLARSLRLRLVNASCPGETTSSMINSAALNNGCESTIQGGPGYRSFAPLHVGYGGSQLRYAVRYLRRHPRTGLVTIDIGANDIFACEQTTADYCTGADLSRVLAKIDANLATILSALRHQAHYRHALVLLTYYALNYGDNASVTQVRELNTALTGPAARYGARIADGYRAFRAASAGSGGDTCAAGLRIKLPTAGCDLHPSALGQRVLAAAVRQALSRQGH